MNTDLSVLANRQAGALRYGGGSLAFDVDAGQTAGAVVGEDGARYTAGARVPTAEAAMDTPFDFDSNLHFE